MDASVESSSYCMVVTTAPDRQVAENLAVGILGNRLAACVQMGEIRSYFLWDGALQKENEVVLSIKTTGKRYAALESYIRDHHPYDVPEIIKLPVTGGLPDYLAWLDSSTEENSKTNE
ncbi:MAG TPA: divalent-cation tolerance protein CutA [Chlorobaculum sp.]|nr:divalent-cation tolerance protein CutA [Chlorobaculum sp.]